MIRPIVKYGHQTLHRPAERVDAVTPELQALIDDMIDTMYAAPGIGLAAPQVGMGLRLFVVDTRWDAGLMTCSCSSTRSSSSGKACSSKRKAA